MSTEIVTVDIGQRLHARHARHDQVQQHHVRALALDQPVDGLAAGFGVDHGIALSLQHGLNQTALGRIVIDYENGLRHGCSPFNITVSAGPRCSGTGSFRDVLTVTR